MIPIIKFCWQVFTPVEVENVSVGDLYNLAQQRDRDLFVLYDRAHRMSILVIPDLVTEIINRLNLLDLQAETPAAAIGLLDMLRQDQMTVYFEQPASSVAIATAWQEAEAVIAVDNDARPRGLFLPGVVSERLPHTSLIVQDNSPQFRQSVGQLIQVGNLAGAIALIEGKKDDFHSERLNSLGVEPFICDDHGKPHKRSRCPCDKHPSARCGRRKVSSS